MRIFCDKSGKFTDIRRLIVRGKKLCQHCGHPIKNGGHRLRKRGRTISVNTHGLVVDWE